MRWPWQRRESVPSQEAQEALAAAKRSLEDTRNLWKPVLEVAEEARSLRARNHFAERLAHAYGTQPAPPYNRRKDDPK